MTYNTIRFISVLNLKLFEPMKTKLMAKEVVEISVMLYKKIGRWATWLQYKCIEKFKSLNSFNSCIYWHIDLKPLRAFLKVGLPTLCNNFVKKLLI